MKNRYCLGRTSYTPGTGQSVIRVFIPFNPYNTPKLQVILSSPSYKNQTKLSDSVTCPRSQSYEAEGCNLCLSLYDPKAVIYSRLRADYKRH